MNGKFLVRPGRKLSLARKDPSAAPLSSGNKARDRLEVERLAERIDQLQDVFWADRRFKLLLVLQGMDTSGKDGVVRTVFSRADPLGMRVVSFKAPTSFEKDRDFLWRVHRSVPGSGEIVIFNRSHYEDVLITRVHGWIDDAEARRRFEQINDFERMLHDTGTVILKFFLHISNDEQRRRLQARIDDPRKHWKFDPQDLEERKHWPAYMRAYEEAIAATAKPWAPWHVVPSDSKTHRDLAIAGVLVRCLEKLKLDYPPPKPELFGITVR